MRHAKFVLTTSCHGMASIQAQDLSEDQLVRIWGIVTDQYTPGQSYQMKQGAEPFLQGKDFNGEQSWVLIEFWSDRTDRIQGFIDYLNSQLDLK